MARNNKVARGAFGLCILALLPLAFWWLYFGQTRQLPGSVRTSHAAAPAGGMTENDGMPGNNGLGLVPIVADSQSPPGSSVLEADAPKPDAIRPPLHTSASSQHDDWNDDDMEILRPQWMSPEATPLPDLNEGERAFLIRPDFVQVVNHEGRLLSEGGWANDLRDGLWTKYHDNGSVASEGHYTNGLSSGLWIGYNEKHGAISFEVNLHNGKPHGVCKYYDGQRDSGLYEHGKLVEKY